MVRIYRARTNDPPTPIGRILSMKASDSVSDASPSCPIKTRTLSWGVSYTITALNRAHVDHCCFPAVVLIPELLQVRVFIGRIALRLLLNG
jgi:hypothetical protein